MIVLKHTGADVPMVEGRDLTGPRVAGDSADCPPEEMGAEDPLFILYTSGSTGKPKGVLHTTGGYLVWVAMTHEYTFDYRARRRSSGARPTSAGSPGTATSSTARWPTARPTLMFEGVPNYPDFSRFWQVVDKHRVEIFYAAPTALRALMREGDEWVTRTSRQSLRLLGSVGEPINPEAWEWYCARGRRGALPDRRHLVADRDRRAHDHPPARRDRPQARQREQADVRGAARSCVDADGKLLEGACEGNAGASPTAGRARCAPSRATTSASSRPISATYPGKYFTGDGCRRDEDGYYWITGRIDDVINVSGHRMGTAEIESALVLHRQGRRGGGRRHAARHQGPGHLRLCHHSMPGTEDSEALRQELSQWVRKEIGPIATPDVIQFAPGAAQDPLGQDHAPDPAQDRRERRRQPGRHLTLADPGVVDDLVANRPKS